MQVELRHLRFGHEAPVHPSNARVGGRMDGIEELAANIHSRGLIEDLIVFDDGVRDGADMHTIWFVADGNRCLAALHMAYGKDSTRLIDCKERSADGAFEDSLAVAVLAHKLHPVDEYEGFAKLIDLGKTPEEVARQYGMTEKQVMQALALGDGLSPKTRDRWRNGEIKAEVAKALTMADPAAQDALLEELAGEGDDGLRGIEDHDVRRALKIGNDNSGVLVEFVGIEAYVARGGKVTRDLFGTGHKVSDPKLAKKMAAERIAAECKRLKEAGWSFAVTPDSLGNARYNYTTMKVERQPTEEEQKKLDALHAIFNDGSTARGYYPTDTLSELPAAAQQAYLDYHALGTAITLRAFPASLMAKAGCFVGVDDDGLLEIEYGRVKPAEKKAAAEEVRAVKRETAKAAAKEGKPAPEQTTLSNALKQRLEAQLVAATKVAMTEEAADVSSSPLTEILARVICAQIHINGEHIQMPDAIRTKLPSIRQVLGASKFGPAIAKLFDAEGYFSGAPKALVLKAVAEAVNPDEARKIVGKTKSEIGKFAIANVTKTGWLPKELRTVHYKGPGSEGYKKPAAAPIVKDPGPGIGAGGAKPAAKAPPNAPAKKAPKSTDRKKKPARKAAPPKKAAKKAAPKKRAKAGR